MSNIGLKLRHTNSRVENSGRTNHRKSKVLVPSQSMTFIFCLKNRFGPELKTLFRKLLNSKNIDDMDKIWINESIEGYNRGAVSVNKTELCYDLTKQKSTEIVPVIQLRMEEFNYKISQGMVPVNEPVTNDDRNEEARDTVREAHEEVNRVEQNAENLRQSNYLRQAKRRRRTTEDLEETVEHKDCLLYTSPSPRDA